MEGGATRGYHILTAKERHTAYNHNKQQNQAIDCSSTNDVKLLGLTDDIWISYILPCLSKFDLTMVSCVSKKMYVLSRYKSLWKKIEISPVDWYNNLQHFYNLISKLTDITSVKINLPQPLHFCEDGFFDLGYGYPTCSSSCKQALIRLLQIQTISTITIAVSHQYNRCGIMRRDVYKYNVMDVLRNHGASVNEFRIIETSPTSISWRNYWMDHWDWTIEGQSPQLSIFATCTISSHICRFWSHVHNIVIDEYTLRKPPGPPLLPSNGSLVDILKHCPQLQNLTINSLSPPKLKEFQDVVQKMECSIMRRIVYRAAEHPPWPDDPRHEPEEGPTFYMEDITGWSALKCTSLSVNIEFSIKPYEFVIIMSKLENK